MQNVAPVRDLDLEHLAQDFERALEAHQVTAAYQPQVDIPMGRVVGVEALARWTHPRRGPIAPDVFVEMAQKTGMLAMLTERMMDDLINEYRRGCSIEVAVNVSATQLEDPALYDMFEDAFANGRFRPETLIVEVTESQRIVHPERVAAPLAALAAHGVMISVDDFGTGHSSFERVEALHARELKLDRSLVQSTERSEEMARIVVEAHARGIRVVGEGVEEEEQFDRLAALGCDRAQGYWIAKPQPPQELFAWYTANRGRIRRS